MADNKQVTHLPLSFGIAMIVFFFGFGCLGAWVGMLPSYGYPNGAPLFSPLPMGFLLFFNALSLPILVLLLSSRIRWNEEGFSYWTPRGKQIVAWDEVTDYGLHIYTHKSSRPPVTMYSLRLASGKEVTFAQTWRHHEAFRDAVQNHARRARVATWGELGLRATDTESQTFTYNARGARVGMLLFYALSLLLTLPILLPAIPRALTVFQEEGWLWGLGFVSLKLVGIVLTPFMAILLGTILFRDVIRRGEQSITVSLDGIRYRNGAMAQYAPWESVSDYYEKPSPGISRIYAVRTGNTGPSIEFTFQISQHALLKKYIERHAPTPPGGKPWRTLPSPEETLGKKAAPLAVGLAGTRIYHYRTRTNRILLLYPTTLVALIPLSYLLRRWIDDGPHRPIDATAVSVFGVLAILLVYAWWRYFAARVVTDMEGITQHAPFSRHHLQWSEVNRWRVRNRDAVHNVVLEGPFERQVRAFLLIAEADLLQEEIQTRTGLSADE